MPLTILDGSTFCICDERGDVFGETDGFFTADTRHLSRFVLRIDGEPTQLLSSGKVEYYSAAFYLRNPASDSLPQDALSIARMRFVGDSMQERLVVTNQTYDPQRFVLALDVGTDFADILTVKDRDFALGNPAEARPLPPPAVPVWAEAGATVVFSDGEDRTQLLFSVPAWRQGMSPAWQVELAPREAWELIVDVVPNADRTRPELQQRRFGQEMMRVRETLESWHVRVPMLQASWDPLRHTFVRSVADLASLRMRTTEEEGLLPAAGMPWFMTVFGRDTLITCLQTLLFGPELAHTALRALASLQALEDDAAIDAEPGKIVHEVRHGKAAKRWFRRYYGTVDATPLFLVLLSEVWRWTDDVTLVEELRLPALRALEWIDRFGDLDADGFVEFERRAPHGLPVQSWKDSWDSQRFADGRIAAAPIAAVEVQGYVYDAKLRIAEIARVAWNDEALAARLEREAHELQRRFDDAFWVDARGGYYALALDREKRRVDALTSNIGHLLWSGIVPPERIDAVVDRLMEEPLWSGWGVRTMSTVDTAFNPLSYHNGTVWPHDNSLIAWGLARNARWAETHRVARRMMEAAVHFGWALPEVFAGLRRAETPFPVAYPTAARPQAWAAGTPVLLLQLCLGLRPDRERCALVSDAPDLPSWFGNVELTGLRAYGNSWDVSVRDGRVLVVEAA